MNPLLLMLTLALLATVAALGAGVVSMVRGGQYDREHSTRLMFTRVGFQGVAVLLMLATLLML